MAEDSKRQEVNQVADKLAAILGVDPEDIATEPSAGRISLTASQARRLLAAHPVVGPPGRDMDVTRNATPSRVLYDEDLQFIIKRLAEATGDPELLRDEPDGERCGWIVTHPITGELGFSSLSVHDHPGLVPVEPVIPAKRLTEIVRMLKALNAVNDTTVGDDFGVATEQRIKLVANHFPDCCYGWLVDEIGGCYGWQQWNGEDES